MKLLRKIYTYLFRNATPIAGEKVKVAVGFDSYLNEGIVSKVCTDGDGRKYCWVDQYDKNGKYKNSFTASFSYCTFYFV